MADAEEKDAPEEKQGGGFIGKLIVWSVIFFGGIGTGVSVALFVLPSSEATSQEVDPNPIEKMDIPEPDDELEFIEFDEITANLDDPRYSRFLICKFQLQITAAEKDAIQTLVDKNGVILKNWLIAHLSERKPDDVMGKLGFNTLRREIHDKFNSLLFTDGIERIQDVLIEDLKVQ